MSAIHGYPFFKLSPYLSGKFPTEAYLCHSKDFDSPPQQYVNNLLSEDEDVAHSIAGKYGV